jgi:hypothetical protein
MDKSGTSYQLQEDTSKLSNHIGHEVRITETSSGSSATSSNMSRQAGGSQQSTLAVHSMKRISKP